MQSISVFPDITKVAHFSEKMLSQQNSRSVARDLYVFWIFFR